MNADTQLSAEDRDSDEHWLRVFAMMPRPALESQCLAYMRQAEINARTVVRQANELRKLAASKSQERRYAAQSGVKS